MINEIESSNEPRFFGEWVPFENEEDKIIAYVYLKYWKKIILKKLVGFKSLGHDQFVIKSFNGVTTLAIKIGVVKDDGQYRTRHQCTDEHAEAATRTIRQLQSEIPPVARGLGEGTVEWQFTLRPPIITNEKWIENLIRNTRGVG